MGFYTELKRRNVFKVAIVYIGIAWLLIQVSDSLVLALHLPDWMNSAVAFLLILGFPIAIVLAWAFELTPDGLKAESPADPSTPEDSKTSGKINYFVIAVLVLALSYFVADKYVLDEDQGFAEKSAPVETDQQQADEPEPKRTDNSIAVLPFVNMSSDAEQEYFSDGLSEELLNLLAKIPELSVAARTSSFSFKDKDVEIPEIATRLKVAHVLEGSVRKHGDQIRITAQLIHAKNGFHVWSETYDRQLDDVFQIQEDIAVAVVNALKIQLLGEAPRTRRTDTAAYQLFLEGQYLKRQITNASLHQAIETFKRAVEIDPTYAPAWAELADTYIWLGGGSKKFSRQEGAVLADEAIDKAISLDPDYAYAYYVRGISWFFTKHQFKQGMEDFWHALELDPENAILVAAIGKGALLSANHELAISQYEKAIEMEPVVPEFYRFIGLAYQNAGRLNDSEASFRTLSRLSPDSSWVYYLWKTLLQKGDLEAAMELADSPFMRAATFHAMGDTEKADENLDELIENANAYTMALAFGYRGDTDAAFEWLDKMQMETDFPVFILCEVALQGLHSDERWPLFLEKLGLLEIWQEKAS